MRLGIRITAAAAALSTLVLAGCGANVDETAKEGSSTEKSSATSLDALYDAAKAEGGKVVIWAGGDAPNQAEWIESAFEKRFPGIDAQITVDLSKFHDVKIDKALATGGQVPDVAHLQTTQDFDRWKTEGALLDFKPEGFDQLWPQYTDPDGAFLPVYFFSFQPTVNAKLVPEDETPTTYEDFLKPEYKDKLVLTPPHDDDAVLYVYDKLLSKYGAGFMRKLAAQNPTWVRGTAAPAVLAGTDDYLGNLTGYPAAPGDPVRSIIPKEDPFIIWPQTGGIFKEAEHPAAAKLYMSWLTSKEFQESYPGWSARMDVAPPEGLRKVTDYPNADPGDFKEFMRDRDRVERVKKQMETFFGPVRGESPLTDPKLLKIVGATEE